MKLAEFFEIADSFEQLGWAVREQLIRVCEGDDIGSKNPNAMEMAWEWLDRNSPELEGAAEIAEEIRNHLDEARRSAAEEPE